MFAAAAVVGMLAFLIGFPILKLKGHYLAMATLGFGIIIYIVFNETVDITGGPSGLSGIPNLQLGQMTFDTDLKNYYLIWFFTLLVILFAVNLTNSRIGRSLRAIHDSEVAARVMGVNARLLKVQIFALSAVISSLAGSLYAHTMAFVAPASFGFNFSVELLTMVVIGARQCLRLFSGGRSPHVASRIPPLSPRLRYRFLRPAPHADDNVHAGRLGAGHSGTASPGNEPEKGRGGRCLRFGA